MKEYEVEFVVSAFFTVDAEDAKEALERAIADANEAYPPSEAHQRKPLFNVLAVRRITELGKGAQYEQGEEKINRG